MAKGCDNNDFTDEFSCVKCINKIVHVTLLPSHIGNEVKGVKNILDSWKNQYKKSFDGILVGYKNIFFQQSNAALINDQMYIHQDISADFYILQPTVGSILKGNINRKSETHIGCVVNNGINASVTLPCPVPKHISKYTSLGKELLFQIKGLEINRRLVRIHGIITEECMKLMKRRRKKKRQLSDSDS